MTVKNYNEMFNLDKKILLYYMNLIFSSICNNKKLSVNVQF